MNVCRGSDPMGEDHTHMRRATPPFDTRLYVETTIVFVPSSGWNENPGRRSMNVCRGSDEVRSDYTRLRRDGTEDAQKRASMPNDEAYRAGFEAAMEQVNSNQQQTPNYAQMAVETGQLVYVDDVLDDDVDSPTYDKYISVFHGTETVQ